MIINPATRIREQKSDAVQAHANNNDAAGLTSTHPLIQELNTNQLCPQHTSTQIRVCVFSEEVAANGSYTFLEGTYLPSKHTEAGDG